MEAAPIQSLLLPDLWQQQAVRALRDGSDVVVHAPTGSGKTFIFELIAPSLKGQAVFTVPTRALANDKRAEWSRRGWEVGIATGDISEGLDRPIVVATLETQRGRLLRGEGPRLLVIDEYQMIADPVRGIHYEQAIAMAPQQTRLLLLSGSVANPAEIVQWLQRIGRRAQLISHRERAVPLEEVHLHGLPNRAPGNIRGWWPRVLCNALLEGLGPILLFAPRRQAAEQLALQLAAALPPCAPLSLTPEQQQLAGGSLSRLLRARVAFHHSGLSFAQRATLIEPLAKAGQLRVVVATMGLASGINFSMRSVAVAGTSYRAGPFEKAVTPSELLQMFGRAGRRGLDETGYALVCPTPPRLGDAQPLFLRRSPPLDWPTLLAVMHHAAPHGTPAFATALQLSQRLFSPHPVPLGCEQSLHSGPQPCGLWVDSERSRFLKRGTLEILNSLGQWEPRLAPPQQVPLSEAWILAKDKENPPGSKVEGSAGAQNAPRWLRAEGVAGFLKTLASGALIRIPGPKKRFARERVLARRQNGRLVLEDWVARIPLPPKATEEERLPLLLAELPRFPGGGKPLGLQPRGDRLIVRLSLENLPIEATRDSLGKALVNPPTRRIVPEPCQRCALQQECENRPIQTNPAQAWRDLQLVEADGTPTRRGVLFSYFQHGEGLAIAAALEDETYPIEDLLFDLGNLRGGPRFSEEETVHLGHLAVVCQQTYRGAEYEGYLRFGIPEDYASGTSEALRQLVLHGVGRQQLLTETLRPGDIERAVLEWRSLLRHITHAPDYPWPRWIELKAAARARLESETASLQNSPRTSPAGTVR